MRYSHGEGRKSFPMFVSGAFLRVIAAESGLLADECLTIQCHMLLAPSRMARDGSDMTIGPGRDGSNGLNRRQTKVTGLPPSRD